MKHFSVWFGRTEAGATDPEGMGGNPNDKIKINAKIGVIILTEIIIIHPQGNISGPSKMSWPRVLRWRQR